MVAVRPAMSPPSTHEPSAGSGTLVLVTSCVFGFVTSVTMIGPLLVDIAREYGISVGRAGLLATAMAIPWALGSPLAGLVSDRIGRRPLIVTALAGVGTLYLLAASAASFGALVGLRTLAGLMGSAGPASTMAAVGDLFPPSRRARAMGWFNMGFSLAGVAGVPLVGVVGGLFGWRAAFAATGAMLVVLGLLIRLVFPAPVVRPVEAGAFSAYRAVFAVPRLANVLGANLVERAMFTMVTIYLPAALMVRFALSAARVAPALVVVALGAIAGNVVGGWLGDRFSRPAVFAVGQLATAAAAGALFGAPAPLPVAVALGAVFGLCSASARPSFLAFASELATAHRGALFGLIGFTNQGGLVLGSALGALVIDLVGLRGLGALAIAQGLAAAALATPLVGRRVLVRGVQ